MRKRELFITGLVIGIFGVVLVVFGNPGNMGFCLSCFVRDIAGALRLHTNVGTSYMRPEVLGLALGAFIVAVLRGEFKSTSGSSPFIRFLLGFCVMVGSLTFLGCPVRAVLRLSAGDLNALVGIVGLVCGIAVGSAFINAGFSLGRAKEDMRLSGLGFPFVIIVLLALALFAPTLLNSGAAHAPLWLSLVAGLCVGALAFKTRFCSIGAFRDVILIRDYGLLMGIIGLFCGAFVLNIATGNFHLGFAGQPVAHTEQLWNFLGLFVVGLSSTLLGGCPLRQIVLASGGNADSAVTVLGLLVGAAFCHNYGFAASASGVPFQGKVMAVVALCFALLVAGTVTYIKRREYGNS